MCIYFFYLSLDQHKDHAFYNLTCSLNYKFFFKKKKKQLFIIFPYTPYNSNPSQHELLFYLPWVIHQVFEGPLMPSERLAFNGIV